jgi:hypothetical protein
MAGLVAALALGAESPHAAAAEDSVVRPASERFDPAAGANETPDFQRHVMPLLGRLGCNGRACHGSFQGKGGFRLSLFGFDLPQDHQALTRGTGDYGMIRVDRDEPEKSLILAKPTLREDHEGGRRFDPDSWEYRLLETWIAAGAKPSPAGRLAALEIEPAEVVLEGPGKSVRLRVVALWEDGTAEDVTCLSRFQAGNEGIAAIDSRGTVQANGRGDTHVVVFYDNGVVAVPVLVPVSEAAGERYPAVAASTAIDERIVARLGRLGIVPAETCGDAEFLRRLSIDVTGTLPAPDEIEKFLADPSPDKRAAKVDELLASPAYAAWWANKLCDFTGNSRFRQSEGPVGDELAVQWYEWMRRRIERNVPYDELVAGIVLATSRPAGQPYAEYAAEVSSYLRTAGRADFALRESLPHYWTRGTVQSADDKALAFAHSFLGTRLQCAQCHKHPYDRWTQGDFKQLAEFFAPLKYGIAPGSDAAYAQVAQGAGQPARPAGNNAVTREAVALAESGKSVAWRELYVDPAMVRSDRSLRMLGDSLRVSAGEDPRQAVMRWLRGPENPFFARAFVNRVWAGYFHRGLVDPPDDLNLANPPSNPQVLDYLAREFVARGYDMRWLHREIALSDAYQRSWRTNDTNARDITNFSRAIPRRLQAEVIYDALKQVVAASDQLVSTRQSLDRRAIGHLSTRMAGTYAQKVFGKPDRIVACDCERSSTPSLLQAIFLQNDPVVVEQLKEGGWFREVEAGLASQPANPAWRSDALVRAAYLRTVSRPPTDAELARGKDYLRQSPGAVEGLRDLVWALVNSREFVLNH